MIRCLTEAVPLALSDLEAEKKKQPQKRLSFMKFRARKQKMY